MQRVEQLPKPRRGHEVEKRAAQDSVCIGVGAGRSGDILPLPFGEGVGGRGRSSKWQCTNFGFVPPRPAPRPPPQRGGEGDRQIALHRLHPPQPVRCGHEQPVTRRGRSETLPSRPRRSAAERLVQQIGVAIDDDPVLSSTDDRRQEPEQAAGSSAEIEQAGSPRKSIGQSPRKRHAACSLVERFAQREPAGVEAFRHSSSA
jgi:hypothetical protein